jgi:hypothetical protein
MHLLAALAGVLLILTMLWDAFETIVLPRRVARRVRLARYYYRGSWRTWRRVAERLTRGPRRETVLSYFAPLSLIVLIALWATGMVFGFALLYWAMGSTVVVHSGVPGFGSDLYMSGSTFFTLGIGDVTPSTRLAKTVTVVEAGTGFGFLALVIGYLPVLYQSFSRREQGISTLDARAGSPPAAAELLRRHGEGDSPELLALTLRDWESWAADVLESHLSYPLLAYYRSQHDADSWLSTLTMILDATALISVGIAGVPKRQAQLTFAMSRHAAVDLAQVFGASPDGGEDRLPPAQLARMRAFLSAASVPLTEGAEADAKLAELRALYEPYVATLSVYLRMPLPPWMPRDHRPDDWETSAWESVIADTFEY